MQGVIGLLISSIRFEFLYSISLAKMVAMPRKLDVINFAIDNSGEVIDFGDLTDSIVDKQNQKASIHNKVIPSKKDQFLSRGECFTLTIVKIKQNTRIILNQCINITTFSTKSQYFFTLL